MVVGRRWVHLVPSEPCQRFSKNFIGVFQKCFSLKLGKSLEHRQQQIVENAKNSVKMRMADPPIAGRWKFRKLKPLDVSMIWCLLSLCSSL